MDKPNVSWDGVAGLGWLRMPLRRLSCSRDFPAVLHRKEKPWSGFLLYGPPGTGKSYLAKAATGADSCFRVQQRFGLQVARQEEACHQSIQYGQGERPQHHLHRGIDSLCSAGDNESEAARRIRLSFWCRSGGGAQLDRFDPRSGHAPVFPDQAVRRQFDKGSHPSARGARRAPCSRFTWARR